MHSQGMKDRVRSEGVVCGAKRVGLFHLDDASGARRGHGTRPGSGTARLR